MPVRSAQAEWKGNLTAGSGRIRSESGVLDADYNFSGRFESGSGTNPEELIAAAHAGCFSMALAHGLTSAGHPPDRISTTAKVRIEKQEGGFSITRIELTTEGVVPGISEEAFRQQVMTAKNGCPVSKALAATNIELTEARLLQG
jgi:osmotically inducible protein OsmC